MKRKGKYYQRFTSGEHALTTEQVKKLLASIDDIRDMALFRIAISCGIRRGDISRLKWNDVDMEKNTITFYEQKKRRVKQVYFDDKVKQVLTFVRKAYPNEYYLFPGFTEPKYGKGHVSDRTIYNKFQQYLVKAGIQGEADRRPFHCLRATCVKICQQSGWTVEKTAKHIGDTVRVVQQHYATPSDEEMREVVFNKPLMI